MCVRMPLCVSWSAAAKSFRRLFSAEVKCMKPQKEMYGHLFTRFNIRPEESFFIDDWDLNIEGAEACGMKGYCFADGDIEKLRRVLNRF